MLIIKGVIEILSSDLELGGLNFHGDKIGNSTCIGCLYPVVDGSLYSKVGVGLLFYPWNRHAKAGDLDKTRYIPHTFSMSILKRFNRG